MNMLRLGGVVMLVTLVMGARCPSLPGSSSGTVVVDTVDDGGSNTAGCARDDDCPFGQACQQGRCAPADGTLVDNGCRVDVDCPMGQRCAPTTGRCLDAADVPDLPPPNNGECTTGQKRFCGSKVGACQYGEEACVNNAWSGTCAGGVGPSNETCDGVDNNCDGITDEGFVLGAACAAGDGVCRVEGTVVCTADGTATTCSAVALPAQGRVELCGNGLDDDCDTQLDEGFDTVGTACTAGLGICARDGVVICSADATSTTCSATPGTPQPMELCGNAVDDNCDGSVDEGFATVGMGCTAGTGACVRAGTIICAADLLTARCSATPGTAGAQELCGNNVDDNCDGNVDETFVGVIGTACMLGTPPCVATGAWACSADLTTRVCQVAGGGAELCNMMDDDNNMCTDEGFDVGTPCAAGLGACRQTGTNRCRGDGLATECSVTGLPATNPERCGNGVDDNCNGSTDEGFSDLGNACTAGRGICIRSGARVCSVDGLSTVCDAVAGSPDPAGERCGNGLDDDCNGATDDGFDVGTACQVGAGVCVRSGAKVCNATGLGTVCNASPGAANPLGELCGNGLDDDCDTQTDEGFDVGTACTVGAGICARGGSKVCNGTGTATVCNATAGNPDPNGELCGNGQDDDCDTFTDEGFPNLGQPCVVGLGACQRTGVYVCSGDRRSTVCNAVLGPATPETCDNVDNDCNGVVDNGCDDDMDGYCDAAMALTGTPAICPNTTGMATRDCNDLDVTVHPGATESCGDARDLDCDGNPNNGCNCGPVPDADFDGHNSTACGGDDCDDTNGSIYPTATERCDGVDNNCNGTLDEGFDADSDNYTTCGTVRPGGGLDPAYLDCDDANATRHPFACELCANASGTVACGTVNDRGNMVDEDCDGYTDETCAPCDSVDRDGDGLSQCDGDCAPTDPAVSPQRMEVCDGKDTDCNRTTLDNCDVGNRCNWPGWPTAGDPSPDTCRDRLICVESLAGNGHPTGNYTCTSFCNFSPQGLGLGDGCTATQTCSAPLTPTANLHGCAVNSEIGMLGVGSSCSSDSDCRSNYCYRDMRFTGNVRYCSDFCATDAYCGNGTTCQASGVDTGRCLRVTSSQTRMLGTACNGVADFLGCVAGDRTCVTIATGNKQCSRLCCRDSDCPANWHCSLDGNDSAGPVGGYDTVPVCFPDSAGTHDRPAGAACTTNAQCISEFCDVNLSVCVDVCCNDTACPSGLRCDSARITRRNGHTSFARVCVNQTPSQPLQPR